ncbi:UDP-N-acetylglucosamine--N-acetylmuramyl-(pentapeptide pyrophosphoryl-undecaprenol N-acetylglucosamine transferase [Limnochorda pilosa]|uniref:UDP-N-acetylglucosamine--N-acetylmuramyl-(pentapeptide) pyrophosphoryl-undecaprenol N-acetylglucosamine transferase n=1 Tax=Limnochorda pilosa TaxID=1555112 RepID=A0A0K2SL36_LIMPI|nr:UDP-N-acetylglucosamine--N-acetylmuramyl-(pentapeptide pyrophosphoryl-undecaprenol N-acetylglucosamine transferase [Limnochorda pilosa]
MLIVAGGTGGHIYPGLSLADALRERASREGWRARVVFAGTRRGLEERVIPPAGYPLVTLPSSGFPRGRGPRQWPAWACALAVNGYALARALLLVAGLRPHVAVGMGGYLTGPVLLGAHLLRVPTLAHEANARPGVANRMAARFVDRVAVGFTAAAARFPRPERVTVTGNPIRAGVLRAEASRARRRFGLEAGRPTLLVLGGSQGARALNEALLDARERLEAAVPGLQVIHQTGAGEFDRVAEAWRQVRMVQTGPREIRWKGWRVVPYLEEVADAMAAADLVCSRAGGSTAAELTALGVPALLVPFAAATEAHQAENAAELARAGAARVLPQAELSGERLARELTSLLNDAGRLQEMRRASRRLGRPEAARTLAELVRDLAGGRGAAGPPG